MKYGHTKDMVHWFEKEKTIYEFRESHIIIYSTEDGLANIETAIDGDTVWLSTDQMAELFQKNKSTISRHIKNIFDEGELIRDSIVHYKDLLAFGGGGAQGDCGADHRSGGSGRNAGGMDDSSGQILDFIWDRRCPLHFYSRCDQPDIHRKADAAYYGAA